MEKPTIILIEELKKKLVNDIEQSELPIICIAPILADIKNQVDNLYMNELNNAKNEMTKEQISEELDCEVMEVK